MPDLSSFIAQYAKPYDPATDTYRRPPFAAPVKAGKATAIYNAHSYHTKVPPQGIEPYITHYTEPGDLILDPFCGSGMTGVAALKLGRRVILNDLSPAAAHIAYNYCTPVDVDALKREFARIKAAVKDEFDWLYGTTCDRCGGAATIQYTVWSDVFECSRCGADILLWDVARDLQTGDVKRFFTCPACNKEQEKKGLRKVKTVPVCTRAECHNCKPSAVAHNVTNNELRLIAEIESKENPYWYPKDEFPIGRQTRKLIRGMAQITRVDQMYTPRNVWAYAHLWNLAGQAQSERLNTAIRFALTGINNYISKRQGYGTGGGGVSGTLYVPSFTMEKNVGEVAFRKFEKLIELFEQMPTESAYVRIGSAFDLNDVPEKSIDYIFTDPPFGESLQYAELNFIWESWLQQKTVWADDCVMNYVHEKDLPFYEDCMKCAFSEMFRVLKHGRWASVVFHNTDDQVWRAIQNSAQAAGFDLASATMFDKEQKTFNQGNIGKEGAAGFDIVLNLHKPALQISNGISRDGSDWEAKVAEGIANLLSSNPPPEHRTIQFLHSYALRTILGDNQSVQVSLTNLAEILPFYFKQVDGTWYLRGETVSAGKTFDLASDGGALAWLNAILSVEPQTLGEIIPKWQYETAYLKNVEVGRLERLLEQNFWQDKKTGRWRLPTDQERAKLTQVQDIADEAHLRVIRKYLSGESDHRPTQWQLVEWLRFAYKRGAFAEVVGLAAHIDETQVDESFRKEYKKIVTVSRMRIKDKA